ncbi:UDP-N-acetylglucosamine 1-carboxyvinyltransferase [Thozetella sp. PMI_491]|nr:UDP-N-acetylglucosamine 1-carboxyvinyltransferase [Thozetella sp. PMI_491]
MANANEGAASAPALLIEGGRILTGHVRVSGSKNASLPIMVASLLGEGQSVLTNVPELSDTRTLCAILQSLGAAASLDRGMFCCEPGSGVLQEPPGCLTNKIRASILLLGPLVARHGYARLPLPGGCAIGPRPISLHLEGLKALGAEIHFEGGDVHAKAPRGLHGAQVMLDVPSVGATQTIMMAASRATGITELHNAAKEPEVVELARVLASMGTEISGAGTHTIVIRGRRSLRPYRHRVEPDRIECGSWMIAGALAGGPLLIDGFIPEHHASLLAVLRAVGVHFDRLSNHAVQVYRCQHPKAANVETGPFPAFPTDLQAPLGALLAVSEGTSVVTETLYDNRFLHVAELVRLGASIRVSCGRATIDGVQGLSGSVVQATDLRAAACLVIAGLVAEGETLVQHIHHLDRGYEAMEQKLGAIGGSVHRMPSSG